MLGTVIGVALVASAVASPTPMKLWFEKPADKFTESCPVGNGRLGAMLFGEVDHEHLVLNENSLWSGRVFDQNRKDVWRKRDEILDLLKAGKNPEAEALVNQVFTSDGPGSSFGAGMNGPYGSYQTLGELQIEHLDQSGPVEHYRRELDLSTATAKLSYQRGGVTYTRELIASHPGQVLVYRLTASREGTLSFRTKFFRQERAQIVPDGDHGLQMSGHLNDGTGADGLGYVARLRVVPIGVGTVTVTEHSVQVHGAKEVLVFVAAGTDYAGPISGNHMGDRYREETRRQIESAEKSDWSSLLLAHERDYRHLFGRVHLSLPSAPEIAAKSTPDRLVAVAKGASDPALAALFFQFGRYLLISSSREGGLPANLQGLWAEEYQVPWNGDYHLDINVQMNYWPAEVTNLSECQLPMTRLIESLVKSGQVTA